MEKQKRKRNKIVLISLLILCIAVLGVYAAGCTDGKPRDNEPARQIITEDIVVENSAGSYNRAQVILPADYEAEKLPLVTLSHGFRGNMDSAGGNYLAESLARAGIATIRMDFARCGAADGTGQVNQYTVDTMIDDQLSCIQYMIDHYNVDSKRIGLYGRSLGGRVAMAMANEKAGSFDYKALALVAPAGNANALQYYMGGQEKWDAMKAKAAKQGSVIHQKVILTPEFFTSIEDYIPSDTGDQFHHPVLVIYNTEDYVVLPATSLECAQGYEDVKITKITSEKSPHGCEMGFKSSKIKDQLIGEITGFFEENL